jgi:hypothetical protein
MNFGAILPDGANSFVTIWPTGSAQPLVSSINPIQGGVVANAAIVPAGTGGSISVFPNTGLHLYGDINGYFTDTFNTGNQVLILGNIGNQSVLHVDNASSADGSRAILGNTSATTGFTWGVLGHSNSSGGGSAGVRGAALAPSGRTYGVVGETLSGSMASLGAAGVFGVDAGGPTPANLVFGPAGVRGESNGGYGVLGITGNMFGDGVRGAIVDSIGGLLVYGVLGYAASTNYGVYSGGPARVSGTLTVDGNFSSANKFFVEPHPFDASKEIRYVSLEGPHAEVYFRGTAQVSQGVTRIAIPQDFRFVADPSTYSTLVTPVGAMATVAVLSEGEEGVVVQASRDVRIHYVVYAERQAIKNPNPIAENEHFRPERDHDVFKSMPESYRRLLMQNGTLNTDGTLNMETARRLGWDKYWEKRGQPAPEPNSQ